MDFATLHTDYKQIVELTFEYRTLECNYHRYHASADLEKMNNVRRKLDKVLTKAMAQLASGQGTIYDEQMAITVKQMEKEQCAAYEKLQKDVATISTFIRTLKPIIAQPYVDLWNLFAKKYDFAVLRLMNEPRLRKLRARISEKEFDFVAILSKAKDSDIIRERKWFSFDWIISGQSNYLKVLEGNYDNKTKVVPLVQNIKSETDALAIKNAMSKYGG